MKEIKLLNGTVIEVTKDGVLIKGDNIRFKIDGVGVIMLKDDDKYFVSQGDGDELESTTGIFDDEEVEDTTHVPTNHELEVWLRSIQSQVTSIEAKVSKLEAKTSDNAMRRHIFPRYL